MGDAERARLERLAAGLRSDRHASPSSDPSRYVKRSAHLPHLGEDAEHELIDEMEQLRGTARRR